MYHGEMDSEVVFMLAVSVGNDGRYAVPFWGDSIICMCFRESVGVQDRRMIIEGLLLFAAALVYDKEAHEG